MQTRVRRVYLKVRMLILGIDPGTATVGLGLVNYTGDDKYETNYFDWIKTDNKMSPEARLQKIHTELTKILHQLKPEIVSIEKLFFATNARTAIAVGQAMGVMMLAVSEAKIPLFFYTPMQVKRSITGKGNADKTQVKKEVRKLLSIRAPNHKKTFFDDVCDALAIAVCHVRYSSGLVKLTGK